MNENERIDSDSTSVDGRADTATPIGGAKYREVLTMALGEAAVSALTVLGFAIFRALDYTVVLGALLGSLVIIGNMAILTVSVNRAVGKYLELRGTRPMDDEEADKFAREHTVIIQNAVTRSYIIRTILMVAVLVSALLLPWFNVIATVVPLLAYRPIMYLSELIEKRKESR